MCDQLLLLLLLHNNKENNCRNLNLIMSSVICLQLYNRVIPLRAHAIYIKKFPIAMFLQEIITNRLNIKSEHLSDFKHLAVQKCVLHMCDSL